MMIYIQRRTSPREVETVDEFETMREARAMLKEYRISDRTAEFYTSHRACQSRHASTQQARTNN